jgi:hypothetical protein
MKAKKIKTTIKLIALTFLAMLISFFFLSFFVDDNVVYVALGVILFNPVSMILGVITIAILFYDWEKKREEKRAKITSVKE